MCAGQLGMMPLDYVDHFKLRAPPFGQAPGAEFFFTARQHEQILDELYHVTRNMLGLALLTGPVGSGKTTVLRQLQSMLPPETYQIATWVMHQPVSRPLDLLRAVSQRLAIRVTNPEPDAVLWTLQRHAQSLHHQGRHLVLFVDEAQMLEGAPAMEVLRAMLNWECDGYKLMGLVLAGLTNLPENMAVDPSLTARIACHGTLAPFTSPEALAYVRHRMQQAGATDVMFDEVVLSRAHTLAGGMPRFINTLCDNMLVRLARSGQTRASLDLLDDVATRLHLRPAPVIHAPPGVAPALVGVAPEPPFPSPPMRHDLLAQADDIAARLAGSGDFDADASAELTPPAGIALPAEATVEMPGDAWPGVKAAGDFLGNNTPPCGVDPRGRAHTDDDVVISILGEAQRRFE